MQEVATLAESVTTRHGHFMIERRYDPSVRVHDFVLKCVGFVGEVTHRDSAGVHGDLHATGFFVSVPNETIPNGPPTEYFVTAKHVVKGLKGREIYFLVNNTDGGTTTFEGTDSNRWWFHPSEESADVAVSLVGPHPTADIISVASKQLATPEILKNLDIGIGDEIFSTGLFTPAPGTARNVPVLRYGNVAMMPGEQIQTELGFADVCLVEARSLGGVSGAPVFVRPTIDFKTTDRKGRPRDAFTAGLGFVLLGLMHGHWDIRESEMNKAFFDHDRKRGVNLGIAIVVPAIKILETINQEALVTMRTEAEERATRKMIPGMDSARSESSQETAEGFEIPVPSEEQVFGDLKKASRKLH